MNRNVSSRRQSSRKLIQHNELSVKVRVENFHVYGKTKSVDLCSQIERELKEFSTNAFSILPLAALEWEKAPLH